MNVEAYHLQGSAFHFGVHGRGQEAGAVIFSSDRFFAALTACAAAILPAAEFSQTFAPCQQGQPPLVFSSLFPRAGGVRFYPRPARLRADKNGEPGSQQSSIKQIKNIAFLSEALFNRLLQGEILSHLMKEKETRILQNGKILITCPEFESLPVTVQQTEKVWALEKRPRVTLDRSQAGSVLFYLGELRFAPECGLWFGLQWLRHDSTRQQQFDLLLRELGMRGLGGERSIGLGAFQARRQELLSFTDLPETGGPWLSLSRYLPAPDEMEGLKAPCASYTLQSVSGWMSEPGRPAQRRRSLTMLAEGAVLEAGGPRLFGSLADVQPDYEGCRPAGHPVWCNGYALALSYPPAGEEG